MEDYCLECAWTAETDDPREKESGQAAVDHHVVTGHSIVSERVHPDISKSDYRVQQIVK